MKKLILSIALCCAATNFFAQNADPAQLVNDGKAALEAKNYQEAYTKFSTYLTQTNNQDSVIAYNCGVCADKIKILIVFTFINCVCKRTVTAYGICRIKNNVVFHIEHNIKTTHTAVAVDKQNFFALFNKGNRKANAHCWLSRASFSGGYNYNIIHNTYYLWIILSYFCQKSNKSK